MGFEGEDKAGDGKGFGGGEVVEGGGEARRDGEARGDGFGDGDGDGKDSRGREKEAGKKQARGMVIGIGDWYQGILQTENGGVLVERWKRTKDSGEWEMVFRNGEGKGVLPCPRVICEGERGEKGAVVVNGRRLREGEEFSLGDDVWNIVEIWG
ncbi:MAG: hypothetical protein L6R41_008431 [Letrouitia leprolyta]|nr:MAG: hypothetical protein L6R41_008431 [Letrouitia leprolyta]